MILGKIHKRCDTLPLARFIDILVDGTLNSLIIYGWADRKTLQATWDTLFQEYTELAKDTSHQHLLATVKEYTQLITKIDIVQALIVSLAKRRHLGIIKALKKFGFHQAFTPKTMESDIKQVIAKIKSWVFRANKLYAELKNTENNKSEVRRSDFGDLLAEIAAFQGYHIDINKITVSEYVSVLNRFKKHIEDGKRRKNNRVN